MNQNSPKAGSVLVKTIKTSCKTHCDILATAQGVIYEPRANLSVLEQGSSVSPVMGKGEVGVQMEKEAQPLLLLLEVLFQWTHTGSPLTFPSLVRINHRVS